MTNRVLNEEIIAKFKVNLILEEKSPATVEKYMRDVQEFFAFAEEREVSKKLVMAWKESLMPDHAARTVNGKLTSLNSLLEFMGWPDCRVKCLKTQRQTFCPEEKYLTEKEYNRLLDAAKDQPQLRMIMETICGTGIRVSELKFITVEAVKSGVAKIRNKGKDRSILIPGALRRKLKDWMKEHDIKDGAIFVTRNGKPVDRSNIWKKMKQLCEAAGVAASKVFPHNLRKLFARCYYEMKKDIAKLADMLGHSSINTTRIYIMTTGEEHLRDLDQMGLVRLAE